MSPLPSLAWQIAQWSAKCSIPALTASGEAGTGLVVCFAALGIIIDRSRGESEASRKPGARCALMPPAQNISPTESAEAPTIARRRT